MPEGEGFPHTSRRCAGESEAKNRIKKGKTSALVYYGGSRSAPEDSLSSYDIGPCSLALPGQCIPCADAVILTSALLSSFSAHDIRDIDVRVQEERAPLQRVLVARRPG